MLYLVGLGLYDHKDMSLRAKEIIQSCSHIYLEGYTSIYNTSAFELSSIFGKEIIVADRVFVESKADIMLEQATHSDVAFLVIGDAFGATTHTDLCLRAKEKNVDVKVVHNASILTAVGEVGLELYKFGKTTSMIYFEHNFKPSTPYDVLAMNKKNGLHTLMLLDIKADQKRFMSVRECIEQLEYLENEKKLGLISSETIAVGCARLGWPNRKIVAGTLSFLKNVDFGPSPHCLIFPGELHFIEEEALGLWKNSL